MSDSSPPQQQQQQLNLNGSKQDNQVIPRGSKVQSPDQLAYFDASQFDLDAFATSSLQAAASAVLAAQQQQQLSFEGKSNRSREDVAELFADLSATSHTEQSDLSRSSSVGRRSQSGADCSSGKEKTCIVHAERHMWTPKETKALVDGCNKHGIGNWKVILNDKDLGFNFDGRTPGDLKDRFRTYFPDAYHELYPNAKTHTSRAVRSKAPDGKSIFEKGKTKERRPFTPAEDEVLRKGYEQFGSHWAIIAKDVVFEGRRKSTDLRDRFRNAFPSLYEQAGYKPRTKSQKKERRQSSSGSFSHSDRGAALQQTDWQSEAIQRPTLQPRSETSTSYNSQAVSEHSEMSEEEESEQDAALHLGHYKEISYRGVGQSSLVASVPSLSSSSMDRSVSHTSTLSDDHSHQTDTTSSPPVGLASSSSTALHKPPHPLRRSQSTKRANYKIGSLDQAVKAAYSKSSKEAVLATHQQAHLQHMLQTQQGGPQQQIRSPKRETSTSENQRPTFHQSVSVGWPSRFTWLPGESSSDGTNMADMDLDQMDAILNSHSATELLSSGEGNTLPVGSTRTLQDRVDPGEAMNIDGPTSTSNSGQADFASLYQQLALAGTENAANRGLSIESFQDLLDPVLPLQNASMAPWDQSSTIVPWTPVSSVTASSDNSIPAHASASSATRRDYEHNQWAGDLLHRGHQATIDQQQTPQGFVSMASMHLSHNGQGIPTSRSADDNLGQSRNDFAQVRPLAGDQLQTTMERPPALRSFETSSYSTPSVHELISRSTRRQSYPPRPVGISEEGEDMMQSAYSNPYPYPADDISLLNSSTGGSLTLFPSLVSNQSNDYSQGAMMRRRRSTDTLREGAYSFTQAWRGGFMENSRQVEEQDEMIKENDPLGQRETASTCSHHGPSEHSRSISDVPTNEEDDDDADAPSRAASVGNMDLVGQRDNVLYAESLPDLSSGMDGHATGSDSAFSQQNHNLHISYDDMDLPSFLNRSPSILHASAAMGSANFAGRQNNETGTLRTNASRAWSVSGITEAARAELFAPSLAIDQQQPQRRDPQTLNKGVSKSVDLTNFAGFGSSFGSNPMMDAGSLDRLEHLYLEGLHTPNSPLTVAQGVNSTGAAGFINSSYSGSAVGLGSGISTFGNATQRYPANNTWWSTSNIDKGSGAGGGDGYESV